MSSNSNLIVRLQKTRWFDSCGDGELLGKKYLCRRVDSWEMASEGLESRQWEYVSAEAQSRLTEYLAVKYPKEYHGIWNRLAREARALVISLVEPQAESFRLAKDLSPVFVDCVKWDVLHALMEWNYWHLRPPLHFTVLFDEIYSQGHIPCGWEGNWPDGSLLYF